LFTDFINADSESCLVCIALQNLRIALDIRPFVTDGEDYIQAVGISCFPEEVPGFAGIEFGGGHLTEFRMPRGDMAVTAHMALFHAGQQQNFFPVLAEFECCPNPVVLPGLPVDTHAQYIDPGRFHRFDADVGVSFKHLISIEFI